MSDEDDQPSEIGFLGHDPHTGARVGYPFGTPEPVFWRWYSTIGAYGLEQALDMLALGARLVAGDITQGGRDYIRSWLQAIKDYGDAVGDREERALRISYQMISRDEWTRLQALRFAQDVLDSDLTATAWRLRLMRYAKKQGLPPLGARGRPRKPK